MTNILRWMVILWMSLGASTLLAQDCDFPNIVNSFSLYGEQEGSFTLTDFEGGEAFTIETYAGTYSLKFRTCDGDYVLLYANNQEVQATCPNDFPSPGYGEAWELNSSATICHPGFNGPIDLTIEYTLGSSCSVWSQGCEDDGTTFQDLTPFDVQAGGGEYFFDNSASITDLPSDGYLRIDMEQGDWVSITAYASGQQIRFAHSPLWDTDGPSNHQAYVESCLGKTTLHWWYRGQYQNINVALKPAASFWSSNCGSGTLVADSIVVTKVRKYMDCTDPATCGCKEYRACNYDASATYRGVCSFRNQHNERRANNTHYIDRFGEVMNLSDGQPSTQFPAGLDFIELGRYAPAGLTSSGELYYDGEWVASGIRCFDALYNSVIAADSSGTLLAFGSGPIAQEPLPSTGSAAVRDIQLTYPFSASAATRAYALLDDGTVTWWPTYPAGNGDSYIEGQDQVPYDAYQLTNIDEIVGGADALYARDKAGYVHKVGSHNWSTDYPFYSPQTQTIPEWAQSRIADITGVGYMHVSFLLDDGRQLHLDASGIGGDQWMKGVPHTMNFGFPFATSSGIYMDHAGQIRDANGNILAVGSLSTNCSGSSIVSPAEAVSCTDSTACNYGAPEVCQFWTPRSRKRFSLAADDIAVLDSLGGLHLWNLDANDTSYAIELDAPLTDVVFEEIVVTHDFGSSGFHEYGCGLDETGQVHTWSFPSYSEVPSEYTDIPSSLTGKTVVRIEEGTGFVGALTDNDQLHIWGVGHWGYDDSRQEWVIDNVADFQLGGWHHDITYTDGTAEWIPTFDNAPTEYVNRPGFGPGVIAQWPGWLQYFDYGAVLYRNGQVGHFGSDRWEELLDSIPEGTSIIDIAPGRCGDCAVALSNTGEIYEYGYAPWPRSEPTNLDGALAVTLEGMWSGNQYYLGADGLVHLTPSQTYVPGGELDSIPASVFCECDDVLPSATCPCTSDADGDGVCDVLDTCNDLDSDDICDDVDDCLDVNANGICDPDEVVGCTDPAACNATTGANVDDGSCIYPDPFLDCAGDCVNDADEDGICDEEEVLGCTDPAACNYNPNATDSAECQFQDALGVCGGDCSADADSDAICDDVDDCVGVVDYCGVCNGPGAVFECGCSDIPAGDCDCDGNQLDALGLCGGTCEADADQDGLCDDVDPCVGTVDACGICNGPGAIYACGCANIPSGDCDCEGNQLDALGECGGTCEADADQDGVCDDVDDCIGDLDACGICNGPGDIYACGCSDIPQGDCDCNGNQVDALGVCGGACEADTDGDGICDTDEIPGCTDPSACNYDVLATDEDGTCTSAEFGYDCNGNCLNDMDGDDVCDEFEVLGCTQPEACNFDPNASENDGSCVLPVPAYDCAGNCLSDTDGDGLCDEFEIPGCQDPLACNHLSTATDDDGSCEYTCCPGPGCCHDGTHWDLSLQQCVVTSPTDVDFSGCTGVGDILEVLAYFGYCVTPTIPGPCEGLDFITYHSINYDIVEIGDECWFIDNLQTELYTNGDSIHHGLNSADWALDTASCCVYAAGDSPCNENCNPAFMLFNRGRLYNGQAVLDPRGLCPSGWHVSTDEDWFSMELLAGVPEEELGNTGGRGGDAALAIRDVTGWASCCNGTNELGFAGQPGGRRNPDGFFEQAGGFAEWWTGTPVLDGLWGRWTHWYSTAIVRDAPELGIGRSIRCVKN